MQASIDGFEDNMRHLRSERRSPVVHSATVELARYIVNLHQGSKLP